MADGAERQPEGNESWEAKFNAAKQHFHNYPHVWYSYLTVFGSLSAALALSYGRMRATENQLREVQARMRAVRQKMEATSSKAVVAEHKPA